MSRARIGLLICVVLSLSLAAYAYWTFYEDFGIARGGTRALGFGFAAWVIGALLAALKFIFMKVARKRPNYLADLGWITAILLAMLWARALI